MELEIITMYFLCDQLLKAMLNREDPQNRMNNAEIMTVVLTAARYFGGNIRQSAQFLHEHGYMPVMLSESRLNRRIHAVRESVWMGLFMILSGAAVEMNRCQEYIADSFPVPVCDNIRISRSKIFTGEVYRGYTASKKRYFYGIRVHMIVTGDGKPVEIQIVPGSRPDISVFKEFNFNLPENSKLYTDKGYTDYEWEDMLKEIGIIMEPIRKKNSVRATDSFVERLSRQQTRKYVETSFSLITNLFPKKIHAVTPAGFCLKILAFVIAYSIQCM